MFLLAYLLLALSSHAEGRSPPVITLNSAPLAGPDVVIDSGSPLALSCEGQGPVIWVPRLAKHKRFISKNSGNIRNFTVNPVSVDFTGTYTCVYTNTDHKDLASTVHIFVRDPKVLFLTPSSSLRVVKKEGEDYLLPCLITNPAATYFQLRMDNGSALPPGMNISTDPRRGILIRNLLPSYNAYYVCSARLHGHERVSRTFSINVIQKLLFPPYVFLDKDEYIRIVGERLKVSCRTHNPNFYYNVTWTHSSRAKLQTEERPEIMGDGLAIQSILTIASVNLSDTGNITCTGTNEAGINSSTTRLLVVDKPFIRLSPKLSPRLNRKGGSIEASEGDDVELGVLIEAYPPIISHEWKTPTSYNTSVPQRRLYRYNNRYETTLLLKRLNSMDQGQYVFYAESGKANASIRFHLQLYQKPVAVVRSENATTLTCTAFGYPAPSILWYQCTGIRPTCAENSTGLQNSQPIQAQTVEVQREEFGAIEVESVLTVDKFSTRMTIECVTFNLVGKGSDTFFAMEVTDKLFTTTLSGTMGIMALLVLLLMVLLYKYKQKPRYEIRWKIIDATDGNNYTFMDPTQLPYNEKWEFPRDKLRLGKILGAGAFGKVLEATAYGLGKEDKVTRVAVKMLKASAHYDEKEALMSELKILSHLGHHKNIVNLLGACTHGGPVLVITEYCSHGDLLNFLRSKANTFLSCIMPIPDIMEETADYKNVSADRPFIRSDSGISSTCSDSYLDMRPAGHPRINTSGDSSCEEHGVDSWPVDMDDLIRFSYQVAQGLDFLSAKNCIHRDVAARNVLLTDGRVAKICDFGLARDIMNDSNYVVKGNARLPVKWMAPESIFDCVYTVQSDVWSYGILLWEIFSLGNSPYPNMLVDTKFYKMIKCGYQMPRPDFAPPEMYTMMKMCWNLQPTERPTFCKIIQLIDRLLRDQPEQTVYQNMQQDVVDQCDLTKCNEESCDPSCEQEEEEQTLMKTNNYQFC